MDFMKPLAEEGDDGESQGEEDDMIATSGGDDLSAVKENDTELADIVDAVAGPGAGASGGGASHKNPAAVKRGGGSSRR